MNSDYLLDDIRELNLSYLLLVQRLINTDRQTAIFRLKIDEEMADTLGRIPVAELARLAQCNQLLCHFALQDGDQLQALIRPNADDELRQVHAAILLGSNERRSAGGLSIPQTHGRRAAPQSRFGQMAANHA